MANLIRLFAPAALAVALGAASFTPAPAHAQNAGDLTRTIVNIADVVFRGQQPYYRGGDYSQDDRLVVGRDQYGRPVYYRVTDPRYNDPRYNDPRYGDPRYGDPRYGHNGERNGPPYGNAYGYYGHAPGQQAKCNKHGKCKSQFYDARYDRNGRDHDDDRDDDRDDGYAYGSHHRHHGDRDDD